MAKQTFETMGSQYYISQKEGKTILSMSNINA